MCFVIRSRERKLSPHHMHFKISLVCCSPLPSHTSWPLTSLRGRGSCSFKMSLLGGDAAATAEEEDEDGLLTGIGTGGGGSGGGGMCTCFGDDAGTIDDNCGGCGVRGICSWPAIPTVPVVAEAKDVGMFGPKCLVSFM